MSRDTGEDEEASCNIDGHDVKVTNANAVIVMEKSAVNELSKIMVSTKKRSDNAADKNGPAKNNNIIMQHATWYEIQWVSMPCMVLHIMTTRLTPSAFCKGGQGVQIRERGNQKDTHPS